MTITKEQVAHWAIEAGFKVFKEKIVAGDGGVSGVATQSANKLIQLAYTAGAEAKLQSLLAGVEMPEPDRTLCKVNGNIAPGAMCGSMIVGDKSCGNRTSPCQHKVEQYTLTQLQTAVAAAVAKEREACAQLMEEQDTQQPKHNAKAIRTRSKT